MEQGEMCKQVNQIKTMHKKREWKREDTKFLIGFELAHLF